MKLMPNRTIYVARLGQELSYMGLDLETMPMASWSEDLPNSQVLNATRA